MGDSKETMFSKYNRTDIHTNTHRNYCCRHRTAYRLSHKRSWHQEGEVEIKFHFQSRSYLQLISPGKEEITFIQWKYDLIKMYDFLNKTFNALITLIAINVKLKIKRVRNLNN